MALVIAWCSGTFNLTGVELASPLTIAKRSLVRRNGIMSRSKRKRVERSLRNLAAGSFELDNVYITSGEEVVTVRSDPHSVFDVMPNNSVITAKLGPVDEPAVEGEGV